MKIIVPKQHGAWAMLLIPYILGVVASSFRLIHIPLFIGWFFLYLATYPLIMVIKGKQVSFYFNWAVGYFFISFVFLGLVMFAEWRLIYFGLAMIPFFLLNIYFVKRKNERAFTNDIVAISVFCIGGLASFYIGKGVLTSEGWSVALLVFLFFLGSTFFVKSMIREKKNKRFRWYSWGYHLIVLLLIFTLKDSWLWILPFFPSLIRAISLHNKKLTIMQLGIIEIINSVIFLVVTSFLFL
ncbi:YwiC-like family protein [Gottfriedia acidiceleris]|uniref:YwiC-like family protein n=1 Tax=Gottfriedia acidiceleris TaxID=371036 RepID=UPI003D256173